MIDIDAHKVGNLKNAMEFANHLRDNFLPDCYVEVSTNGNGAQSSSSWTRPLGRTPRHAVLRDLDHWLKAVLARTGIELHDVEIKGTCAMVSWNTPCPTHTTGQLAKLPREWERFGAVKAKSDLHRPPAPMPSGCIRLPPRRRGVRSGG